MQKESKVQMDDQNQEIDESFGRFIAVACSLKIINEKYEHKLKLVKELKD